MEQVAPKLKQAGAGITMYASSRDEALRASKQVNGFRRAGDATDGPIVVAGIDTVDVSAAEGSSILGHSYYAENPSVLGDIFRILKNDDPPSARFGLRSVNGPNGKYWALAAQ